MELVNRWASEEEYSHGFLISVVTIWLFWVRRQALRANIGRAVWAGPIVVLIATIMHLVGEMSAPPSFRRSDLSCARWFSTRTGWIPIVRGGNLSDIVSVVRSKTMALADNCR